MLHNVEEMTHLKTLLIEKIREQQIRARFEAPYSIKEVRDGLLDRPSNKGRR